MSDVNVETTAAAPVAPVKQQEQGGVPAGSKLSTSLYVGDLASDVAEPMLFQHFSASAPVTSVRVCRNALTRESLGYAYVNFSSVADAQKAMSDLNFSNINGRMCRVMFSQRDPAMRRSNVGNLFIKNLPAAVTPRELFETFKLFGSILSCKVAMTPKGDSKGYAFVHFESEEDARRAIEELNGMEFSDRRVEVMPYIPKDKRSGVEWTNVFVKNLPKAWDTKELTAALGDAIAPSVLSAVVMKDEAAGGASKGFGFVSFKSHEAAVKAVEELNGKEVAGEPVSTPPAPKKPRAPKPGAEDKKEDAAAAAADETKAEDAAAAPAAASKPGTLKLVACRALKKVERERLLKEKAEAAKRERLTRLQGCNLYVRNLDETVDDAKLREAFAQHGTITSATVARNEDGSSRLFGFVCYSAPEEAAKAVQAMHHKMLASKPLYVALWQSKEQRLATMADVERRRTANAARNAAAAGAPGGMAGGANAANAAFAASMGLNPAALAAGMGGAAANPLLAMMPMLLMQQQQQALAANAAGTPAAAAALQQQQMLMQNVVQWLQQVQSAAARVGNVGAGAGRPGVVPPPQPQLGGRAAGPAGFPQVAPGPGGMQQQQPNMQNMLAMMANAYNPAMLQQQQQAAAAAAAQQQAAAAAAAGARGGRRGGPVVQTPQQQQAAAQQQPAVSPGGARVGVPAGVPPQQRGVPAAGPAAGARAAAPAAAVARGPAAAPVAAQVLPGARNQPAAAAVPAAAAPAADAASFAARLAAVSPEERKNMIGERLYAQISRTQPERVGKITGMLLEGMDDSELLHLIEYPADLEERVQEALQVLRQHEAETGKASAM